jgi:chromate transporter
MSSKRNDPRVALKLFLYFFRIGWFTFGGGFSIIAQMQKDFVEKEKLVSEAELLDQSAVGRSLPGLMIANVSYLFGLSLGGPVAGVASILGIMLPPVILLSAVTLFYTAFRENVYVARALLGVRAAVPPIIAMAALKLRKGALRDKISWALFGAATLASVFTGIGIVYIILAGAVFGIVISEVRARDLP